MKQLNSALKDKTTHLTKPRAYRCYQNKNEFMSLSDENVMKGLVMAPDDLKKVRKRTVWAHLPPSPPPYLLQVRSQYSSVHVFTVSPMRALKKHILVFVTRDLALTTQYLLQRRLLVYP